MSFGDMKRRRLESGESFITSEPGNSMTPLISHRQKHLLEPCGYTDVSVGDIVFCRVRGSYMTHLVTAVNGKRGVQISNNHGHVNGWTKAVYGKVIRVLG